MRLVLAVLQTADLDHLMRELADVGVSATQIEGDATVGHMGLAAVMAGVEDELVADVVAILRANARGRSRHADPLRPIGERSEFWIPAPFDQVAGGASVYVLPVWRFERIGYA